jgi:hypothetical protein
MESGGYFGRRAGFGGGQIAAPSLRLNGKRGIVGRLDAAGSVAHPRSP